jgi:hypothetical protein
MAADASLPSHSLVPHPASPTSPVREIRVRAGREGSYLVLDYWLTGELDELLLPEPRAPGPADELWRHTCFEAFVGRQATSEYAEYNFSPSGEWAAYRFSAYRTDMRRDNQGIAPRFGIQTSADTLRLSVTVDIRWLTLSPGGTVHLGVTAVIEDRRGGLSYWALRHSGEKPDFHRADSFVLDVL